jgi:peptide/nickel transport system ATP-binding protein
MTAPLLEVTNLRTRFATQDGSFFAADGISFTVAHGAALGIVGESGSGKSVTALSLMRLVADPPGRIVEGSVRLRGRELLALTAEEMRKVRGNQISMVFQEPMTSLNPVLTVGEQVAEALRLHKGLSRRAASEETVQLFQAVGLSDPAQRAASHPHQLSGGMRQRIVIAMALACGPEVLIADEPTTALDVTIQAQILSLLRRQREERRMAVVLISHSLGVVAELCEQVIVMYAGRVVESGSVGSLFRRPAHPYTLGLLRSMPSFGEPLHRRRLHALPGVAPGSLERLGGCPFRARCERATQRCAQEQPPLSPIERGHEAACFFPVTHPA